MRILWYEVFAIVGRCRSVFPDTPATHLALRTRANTAAIDCLPPHFVLGVNNSCAIVELSFFESFRNFIRIINKLVPQFAPDSSNVLAAYDRKLHPDITCLHILVGLYWRIFTRPRPDVLREAVLHGLRFWHVRVFKPTVGTPRDSKR